MDSYSFDYTQPYGLLTEDKLRRNDISTRYSLSVQGGADDLCAKGVTVGRIKLLAVVKL